MNKHECVLLYLNCPLIKVKILKLYLVFTRIFVLMCIYTFSLNKEFCILLQPLPACLGWRRKLCKFHFLANYCFSTFKMESIGAWRRICCERHVGKVHCRSWCSTWQSFMFFTGMQHVKKSLNCITAKAKLILSSPKPEFSLSSSPSLLSKSGQRS